MKHFTGLLTGLVLWTGMAFAQSPVTVSINHQELGAEIPTNFVGLSFGMKTLLPDKSGAHFFSADNLPLVTLFQNLGLRHLRVGGTTVESPPDTPIPDRSEIDHLFAFARVAGVNKIIYSLRLMQTNADESYAPVDARIARYIWDNYQPWLDCFAIGNEPDRGQIYRQDPYIHEFYSYFAQWQKYASAIFLAAPQARFAGPDAGSGNVDWTMRFAKAANPSGLIEVISEHYYAGGKGKGLTATNAIDAMLSPKMEAAYQNLYDEMAAPVMSLGLRYRFTEANDHYSGGVPGASDSYAGALWALDFLHWWAAHSASGVDFHNTEWVSSDVITLGQDGRPDLNAKAYGIKAFDLGSHGASEPVTITNADNINLTAYAVRRRHHLLVTIINREHWAGARMADVTIRYDGIAVPASAIFLTVPDGGVTAKTEVNLNGSLIHNDAGWKERWIPLVEPSNPIRCTVKVPAASAVIVDVPIVDNLLAQ